MRPSIATGSGGRWPSRRPRRLGLTVLAALTAALPAATPARARVIEIPTAFRAGPPQGGTGDGLTVRFKDSASGCGLALCRAATDTVTVQVTTAQNVNFLLNQGCAFGPFNHGCGYFQTRWDSHLDIRVAGDYVFSMQADDQASVSIGDTTILVLDGANWFPNVTSDTVRFAVAGSYPIRAYYADCQPCCRGFRLGGMGPPGSGMMAFTAGFNFNNDLGPCCTFGQNGPGASVIPAALFFRQPPVVSVETEVPGVPSGAILRCSVTPNPARGRVTLALELARAQAVWADVFDVAGRRVATLAAGDLHPAGVSTFVWSTGPATLASQGTLFYRVRTGDGSRARGTIVSIR